MATTIVPVKATHGHFRQGRLLRLSNHTRIAVSELNARELAACDVGDYALANSLAARRKMLLARADKLWNATANAVVRSAILSTQVAEQIAELRCGGVLAQPEE